MTEHDFDEILKKYEFKKYAEIKSNGVHAKFENVQPDYCSEHGYVYLWVEKNSRDIKVVYVGKAGKTMKERCRQHEGGFKGWSKTGKKHSEEILKGINNGKCYSVFVRKSYSESVLGEKGISMCCVEELALIKKFQPRWNSIHT